MTYEEFKNRALNPIYTVEPAVYRVDIFRIVNPDGNMLAYVLGADDDINHILESDLKQIYEIENKAYYPRYKVYKSDSYIFPTFDNAIRFLQSDKVTRHYGDIIFCIKVYELPFGKNVISDCCKRKWIFDENGNLIEQSACSSLFEDLDKIEGHFWGRSDSSLHFKPGDIVEVLNKGRGEVRLAVIVSLLNDIDSCWREYQKVVATCELEGVGTDNADSNYWLNAHDDCYYLVFGSKRPDDFSYINTTDVFTPHFPIPAELRNQLLDSYHKFQNKLDSNNINKYPTF